MGMTGTDIVRGELDQAKKEAETQQNPQPTDRPIVRASDLLREENTEMPMLFDPVFPSGVVSILAGESDACKSMLLRNMAICCALGRPFLGWEYRGKHRNCIFVSTEDAQNQTRALIHRHNVTLKLEPDSLNGLRFIFDGDDILEKLKRELAIEPTDLIVMDAYSDLFDGKEQNSAAQTRAFIKPFKALADEYKCHIIFLHHTGKGKENLIPSKNNFVGSQSLEASVRVGIELRTDKDDPSLRHFCVVKHNYQGNYVKQHSFVLRMDENFIFTNTGKRVPFEDLGETYGNKAGRKQKDVDTIDKSQLTSIFVNGNLNKRNLMAAIRNELGVGTDVAQRIIIHAEDRGWIKNVSTNKSSCEYEFQN